MSWTFVARATSPLKASTISVPSLRQVDLRADRVETVAGTGSQGEDREGGAAGPSQTLSSPWDLCVVGDQLYIAMAGQHQIWTLFLRDGVLFGKR